MRLTIYTVCNVLLFYYVLFVCVHAAFYGVINDNNNNSVSVRVSQRCELVQRWNNFVFFIHTTRN